jgi:nucleoside phosphorylase
MTANRAWIERNLGFDPINVPAPTSIFAFKAAAKPKAASEDLQREIIDFDSDGPEGIAFMGFSKATGLSRFTDIPWPNKLKPKPDTKARKGKKPGTLPEAEVLIVTWTVDEGHALSRVLTSGKDSRNDYVPYTKNFAKISKKMRNGCPALQAKRLGSYWTTRINGKRVVIFKSDSHMSQDTVKTQPRTGATLPNEDVWEQIIREVKPELVITTGTAGGIGKTCEVGDVVVSPIVRFDGTKWLKKRPYGKASFHDGPPSRKYLSTAKHLFKANAGQLPKDNKRSPRITIAASLPESVVTTDFFGFDTSDNHWKLKDMGAVCEMGDAILGLVTSRMGKAAPSWVAVRNVSDPQIKAEGSRQEQSQQAALIYKGFGRWSSVCSALVCWALVAAQP